MGAIGEYMKIAFDELERIMKDVGKEIRTDDLWEIVKQHAIAGAVSGVGAAALPGVGAVIATGAAVTSTVAMYVRLSKVLGVSFKEGALRALASVLIADLSSYVVTTLTLSAALSFIPIVGQAGSAVLCAAANFSVVYLAAYIFIKTLTKLFKAGKKPDGVSEEELQDIAKEVSSENDLKDVVKEASKQYKENKENKENV
ncbi:MAG: hypothetical protein IKB34_00635 [Clostridia bacterium]|nr:hypothetical protein [Clostridia bacterium]